MSVGHFLSEAGFRAASQSVVSAFTTQVELILRDESVPLESFEAQLHLLSAVFASDSVGIKSTLLPTLYIFAYLVPNCYESPDSKAFVLAQSLSQVWQQGVESGSAEQQGVFEEIGGKLRSLLLETQTRILYVFCLLHYTTCHGIHFEPMNFSGQDIYCRRYRI